MCQTSECGERGQAPDVQDIYEVTCTSQTVNARQVPDADAGTGFTAGAIISAIPAVGAGGAGGTEPLLSPTPSSKPSPRLINTSLRGLLIRKVYTSSHY